MSRLFWKQTITEQPVKKPPRTEKRQGESRKEIDRKPLFLL